MSRRRPSLAVYIRRRWRVIGGIFVLLLAALLVLAVTDRGHDPVWRAGASELDQAAMAPDGSIAYALLREDGNITRLTAHSGIDGSLLWGSGLLAPRAFLAADSSGVAVATDFPRAILTTYAVNGTITAQTALNGHPVALATEGSRVVVALQGDGNPVSVYDSGFLAQTLRPASSVRALSLQNGILAVGASDGILTVYARNGTEILNTSLGMGIRSLRISPDGSAVVVGGAALTPLATTGMIALVDLDAPRGVRWSQTVPIPVGLVDTDAGGLYVLAIEEEPPMLTVHVYDGATGATRWTRLVSGSVARDDSGSVGGAALSPDARVVVLSTLRDDVLAFEAKDGTQRWKYRSGGANVVTFAEAAPERVLVGARLIESRPFDSLMLFKTDAEPLPERASVIAGAIVALGSVSLVSVVGIGFWRARRSY